MVTHVLQNVMDVKENLADPASFGFLTCPLLERLLKQAFVPCSCYMQIKMLEIDRHYAQTVQARSCSSVEQLQMTPSDLKTVTSRPRVM